MALLGRKAAAREDGARVGAGKEAEQGTGVGRIACLGHGERIGDGIVAVVRKNAGDHNAV